VVLAHAERVEEVVRRAARGEQGRLAVGFTSSAALHPFVSAVLRHFREVLPGVSISLEEAGTGELVDALLHERLDAAFVRSPVSKLPGLMVDDILDEPMIAALPAGHPLASDLGTPLPLADLASEAFILYRRPAGPGLYDAILAACRGAGFSPAITLLWVVRAFTPRNARFSFGASFGSLPQARATESRRIAPAIRSGRRLNYVGSGCGGSQQSHP
jgi:DNA-binding transcriptional LysR family regulator